MTAEAGGRFIDPRTPVPRTFTPEDFSEEQRMIAALAEEFITEQVLPRREDLERQQWQATIALLRRCGELGLIGIEVPPELGGEGLDTVTAILVSERFGRYASFGVSYGGQAGIGTLPILYFGTEELKKAYLPRLCRAELLSAYALSEAGSGSDALSAKTKARRDSSGNWTLNGEKMWITNGAFADLFITFAQAEGYGFSCFLVEKGYPGVSTGAEEHKMGLKGSSTRTLLLDNAAVPAGNVLGELGKGHRVAFNILNVGRVKLAAAAVGLAKAALEDAAVYARQRTAFGKPIAQFGAIRHKLAEMETRIWVAESVTYRVAALVDSARSRAEAAHSAQPLSAVAEFAVECSIAKVFASEALDFAVDEAVQIHGGNGYSSEYSVERYYRDARVYRIFEGTNEINRLIIGGRLLNGAALDATPRSLDESGRGAMRAVRAAKECFGRLASLLQKAFGDSVQEEQEILFGLGDIAILIYASESALCRAAAAGGDSVETAIADVFTNDAMARTRSAAANLLAAVLDGGDLRQKIAELDALLDWTPLNALRLRRGIADHVLGRR